MQNKPLYRKIAPIAMFTAFAVILSYVESFLPSLGIPGAKLGIPNLVIVLTLYLFGEKEALLINLLRILIVASMFGNLFEMGYGVAGAMVSLGVMIILKRTTGLSLVSVSIFGGVFHNIAQVVVATLVVEDCALYWYLPVLILAGMLAGGITGIIADLIYNRIRNMEART